MLLTSQSCEREESIPGNGGTVRESEELDNERRQTRADTERERERERGFCVCVCVCVSLCLGGIINLQNFA